MVIGKSELSKMTPEMKKNVVLDLYLEVEPFDTQISERFDYMSDKLLDEKIEVLQRLANGEKPDDIEGYEDILEIKN